MRDPLLDGFLVRPECAHGAFARDAEYGTKEISIEGALVEVFAEDFEGRDFWMLCLFEPTFQIFVNRSKMKDESHLASVNWYMVESTWILTALLPSYYFQEAECHLSKLHQIPLFPDFQIA